MAHNRNRTAGLNFERSIVHLLREIGYEFAVTARSESKSRDDAKVDIMNKDEDKNGRMTINIQAKNTVNTLNYAKVLEEMPNEDGILDVVFHNQTEKKGTRFIRRGRYALLGLGQFLPFLKNVVKYKKGFDLMFTYFDSISDEEQVKVYKQLKQLDIL